MVGNNTMKRLNISKKNYIIELSYLNPHLWAKYYDMYVRYHVLKRKKNHIPNLKVKKLKKKQVIKKIEKSKKLKLSGV